MSKNFELLTQLGESIDFQLPPDVAKAPVTEMAEEPMISLHVAEARPKTAARRRSSHQHFAGRLVTASPEEIQLVQQVFLIPGEEAPRSVVFCGVENRDGSNLICARAGEILATRMTGRVCLLDTDLDLPTLHSLYGFENDLGLTDAALMEGGVLSFARQIEGSNLWLVPAGSKVGGKRIIISADRLRELMDELRRNFDYVLVSAPPAHGLTDARMVGQISDGIILVLAAGSTRRATAVKVQKDFEASNVKLLGAILSGRTFPIPETLYKKL